VGFDSIPQMCRSAIVTDEDSVSVHWIVENTRSLDGVHDDLHVFIAGRNQYVHVRYIVANCKLFFADGRLDR